MRVVDNIKASLCDNTLPEEKRKENFSFSIMGFGVINL